MSIRTKSTGAVAVAGTVLLLVSTACAHVKRQEFQAEMARLEQDIRDESTAGDAALGDRIDGLSGDLDRTDRRVSDVERRTAESLARTEQLESDLRALAVAFSASVERIENTLAFNAPVHFDYNSAVLRDGDLPVLQRLAAVMAEHYPDSLITVEGFTDSAGPVAYNLVLGKARADAVRTFLVDQGSLRGDQVRTVSYGEAEERQVSPGASGPGDNGLPNRRVTLVIETTGSSWDIAAPDNAAMDNAAPHDAAPHDAAPAEPPVEADSPMGS